MLTQSVQRSTAVQIRMYYQRLKAHATHTFACAQHTMSLRVFCISEVMCRISHLSLHPSLSGGSITQALMQPTMTVDNSNPFVLQ